MRGGDDITFALLLEIDILVYEVFLDCLNDFCVVVVIFVVLEIRLIFNILVLIVVLVLLDCLVPEIVMELLQVELRANINCDALGSFRWRPSLNDCRTG